MNTYVTGAVIKALREQKNCTQQQLADQLHLSAKTISKWETGKGLPDITLLEPLAALGGSVIDRLGDKHNEHTQKTAITVKVMAVRLVFMKQTGIISLRTCPRRSRNTACGSRRRLSPADGWLPSLSWP